MKSKAFEKLAESILNSTLSATKLKVCEEKRSRDNFLAEVSLRNRLTEIVLCNGNREEAARLFYCPSESTSPFRFELWLKVESLEEFKIGRERQAKDFRDEWQNGIRNLKRVIENGPDYSEVLEDGSEYSYRTLGREFKILVRFVQNPEGLKTNLFAQQ